MKARHPAAMSLTPKQLADVVAMNERNVEYWAQHEPNAIQTTLALDSMRNAKGRVPRTEAASAERREVGAASRDLVRLEALAVLKKAPTLAQTRLADDVSAATGLSYSRTLTLLKQLGIPARRKSGSHRRCGLSPREDFGSVENEIQVNGADPGQGTPRHSGGIDVAIVQSVTSQSERNADILPFPNPLRHKTQPLPTKRDRTLFVHGEFTEDGKSRYCARCDLFWGIDYDHVVHFNGRR